MDALQPTSRHKSKYEGAILAMNVLLAVATVAAVGSLVVWHGGFQLTQGHRVWLRWMQAAAIIIFVLDRLARLVVSRRRQLYLRENVLDFMLIALLAVALLGGWALRGRLVGALSPGTMYVIVTQAFISLLLLVRVMNLNMKLTGSGIPPVWLLMASFAALSLAGSGLLMLPAATPADTPITYMDSLFTSVSATCVTGLVVRDTGTDFTPFGQTVILMLIQLGGLGIMLFGTAAAIAVGKGLSFRSSSALGEMLSIDTVGQVQRTMRFVVLTTFALEAIGAAMMFPMFTASAGGDALTTGQAVWYSVFHSVSAFCNAGFALYADNMMHGVEAGWSQPLRDHWQIMGVMAPLIILGGLGFPVLRDCGRLARRLLHRACAAARPTIGAMAELKTGPIVTLHSKVVLSTSAVLLIAGAVGMLLAGSATVPPADQSPARTVQPAPPTDWEGLSAGRRIAAAVFQSVTARTAGFNTVDVAQLGSTGKLGLCGLMVVGGSPASTAGGMKTVTVALLVLTTISALRRRRELEAFRRSISLELMRKAVAIGVLYLGLVGVTTLLLTVAMGGRFAFIDLLFEACSACGTVGLSTGVTRHLTAMAKPVIVGAMFVGRLGPLTLLLAMTSHIRHVDYTYPTENVLIG